MKGSTVTFTGPTTSRDGLGDTYRPGRVIKPREIDPRSFVYGMFWAAFIWYLGTLLGTYVKPSHVVRVLGELV